MFGFSDVSKKGPYGERLCFGGPNILNRCFERRLNRALSDNWMGTEELMHLPHSIISDHTTAAYRKYECEDDNELGFSSSDYDYKRVEKHDFGMENEDDTAAKRSKPNNAPSCPVPVISHGLRKKACIKSNYIYNPLPIRKKSKKRSVPPEAKDAAYWAQRVKNNIAARKSREERRRGEMEVVQKCESLLSENCQLRQENGLLQAKLKVMESFLWAKLGGNY